MAWVANRTDDAARLLERARAGYDELRNEVARARVDSKLAEIDFNQGRVREAVERMTPALAAIERLGEPEEVAALAAQLGRFLVFARDYEPAAEHLERALALAEELGLPETLAQALNSKSVLMLYRGRPREAQLLVRGALAVALEHDLHDPALRAYNNVVADAWYACRFREELALIDEALDYARRTGERLWELSFLSGTIGGLHYLGRWDEALGNAEATEAYASTEYARGLLLSAALIHVQRGDVGTAREIVDRHADIGRSGNIEFSQGFAAIAAAVLAAEGRHEEALREASRALEEPVSAWWIYFDVLEVAAALPDADAARQLVAAVDEATRGKGWGVVDAQMARLRARGPELDAIAELEDAERRFREFEAPFHLAVVQTERAEQLVAVGRADEAARLFGEARATFERLRARPWLERVDAALGREQVVA
jgi:tetratricopeptide (TPR) repeat protein